MSNKPAPVLARREFLATGSCLSLAASLGGLGLSVASLDARAATSITFMTPFGYLIGFAPVLWAVTGGHFEKEGLKVDVQGGKGSAQAVQQVLSGQAKFCRTGGVDLMRAVGGQGAPLKAIATVTQASPLFMISNSKKPIDGPNDMKGKTIGITSKGGLAENLLDMMLEDKGIKADTINREAVGNAPGAFALIEQGRIDAYIASMGTVVALEAAKQPVHSWNTDRYAPIPGQVYVAGTETIQKEPALIEAFLRAVNNSMNDLYSGKDLAPVIESFKTFKMRGIDDVKTAEKALRAEMELFAAEGKDNLLRNVPARWQKALDLMAKVGLAKAGDASQFYTNAFIDKAKRG